MAFAYMKTARNSDCGSAEIPLYDETTGKIINRVTNVDSTSCLKFLCDKKKTGYTDISGVTAKMVMRVPIKGDDGKVVKNDDGTDAYDEGTNTVEIVGAKGNDYLVKINDTIYSVYKGVTTFYKI